MFKSIDACKKKPIQLAKIYSHSPFKITNQTPLDPEMETLTLFTILPLGVALKNDMGARKMQ